MYRGIQQPRAFLYPKMCPWEANTGHCPDGFAAESRDVAAAGETQVANA